jgi:hypothetical protein
MQYARNIASGNGFSFNAGEPGYGVTSPLWVLFITIPYYLGFNALVFSKVLDLSFFILSVLIFYQLACHYWERRKNTAVLAVSVFMINAWIVRWTFTGMETSFAVFLTLAAFYLYFRGSYNLLFFSLGALQLVRPETFILAGIFFIFFIIRQMLAKSFSIKNTLTAIFCYLVLIAPFFIYAYNSFGTILPNTAFGKSTLTLSTAIIINQLKEIFKTLSAASAIEMLLTAVFILMFFRKDRKEEYYLPLIWIAGLIMLYTVTDADIISRYLLIISPFFIFIGFSVFARFRKLSMILYVVIYLVFTSFSEYIFYNYVKPHTDNFSKGVNECFIPVGMWLNQNTPQGSKILVNDVGAIGYYSNRYIIDAAALINSDLDLNRRIMNTTLEKRLHTHMLLDAVNADYVIDRDTDSMNNVTSYNNFKLEMVFMKEFPSLGIKDDSPKYYKVYKVIR